MIIFYHYQVQIYFSCMKKKLCFLPDWLYTYTSGEREGVRAGAWPPALGAWVLEGPGVSPS